MSKKGISAFWKVGHPGGESEEARVPSGTHNNAMLRVSFRGGGWRNGSRLHMGSMGTCRKRVKGPAVLENKIKYPYCTHTHKHTHTHTHTHRERHCSDVNIGALWPGWATQKNFLCFPQKQKQLPYSVTVKSSDFRTWSNLYKITCVNLVLWVMKFFF